MTFAIQIKAKQNYARAAFSIFKILFGHKFFYLWYVIFISSSEAKTHPMAFQKENLGFAVQHYCKLKSIRWFKGKKIIAVPVNDLQGKANGLMVLSAVPWWEIDALS